MSLTSLQHLERFFGLKKAAGALVVLGLIQRARGKSLRGPVSAAAFIGVYHASRNLLQEVDLRLRRHVDIADLDGKLRRFAPGFLGALAACAVEPSHAVALWVLWLWTRIGRFCLPSVPYAEILFGSAAAGINLSTYLWDHRNLAPAYSGFLAQCGGSNGRGLKAIEQIRLVPNTERLSVARFCSQMHSGESHWQFARNSFLQGMIFGAKIQIPLHIVTHLAKQGSLQSTLVSLTRAILFLGAYPSAAMLIMCSWRHARASETQLNLTLLGSLVGVTLFVESPSRRKEIAAFTFTHALLSIWRSMVGRKQLTGIRANILGKLLFSTAFGVLMTFPEAQPSFLQWAVRR